MSVAGKRVCILTGSGGTLGTAFCQRFSGNYQIVAVWCRRPPVIASQEQYVIDPLDLQHGLIENSNPVFTIRANIINPEATIRVVEEVIKKFGRIDLIIHAAAFRFWAPILDGDALLDSLGRHFAVNVQAPLRLTFEVARRFWANRSPENRAANRNVITLSSVAGLRVFPGYGQSAYSASKAALNILTKHMASELEPLGIRVNALAPDTFPHIVSMERVMAGLLRLDQGSSTGKILALEAASEIWM